MLENVCLMEPCAVDSRSHKPHVHKLAQPAALQKKCKQKNLMEPCAEDSRSHRPHVHELAQPTACNDADNNAASDADKRR